MSNNEPPAPAEDTKFGAREVVEFVLDRYTLGRTTDGVLFAVLDSAKAAKVVKEVRSLRAEISSSLWNERRIAVGREAIGAAIETLCGLAADAPVSRVHLRAAEVGKAIHIDLGDRTGRFVEVSAYGWELRDPVAEDDPQAARAFFRRTAASKELPAPDAGGSREMLRELLDLDSDDARWHLIWGWLVASVFESVPRPILWALGPQGSGKSTRARMVLSVIDPTDALGREPGKNERDDTTAAAGRFAPSFDNIGSVSAATSDWLCRLTTGVEIGRRALYSDDDLRVSTLRRTAVATSIVLPFGLGADALERLVLVDFERVPEARRRPERELWERFRREHGQILGALLDDVAGVLRNLSAEQEAATNLPRMADYALILRALDVHTGQQGFARAYEESVRTVLADRALSDPLTSALLAHVQRHDGEWRGSAATLLKAIDNDRPDDPRAAWPRSPRSLSDAVRRSAETLRAAGLVAERGRSNGESWIRLSAADSALGSAHSPPDSALAPADVHGNVHCPREALPQVDAPGGPDSAHSAARAGVHHVSQESEKEEGEAPGADAASVPARSALDALSAASPGAPAFRLSLDDVLDDNPPTAAQREAQRAWDRGEHIR